MNTTDSNEQQGAALDEQCPWCQKRPQRYLAPANNPHDPCGGLMKRVRCITYQCPLNCFEMSPEDWNTRSHASVAAGFPPSARGCTCPSETHTVGIWTARYRLDDCPVHGTAAASSPLPAEELPFDDYCAGAGDCRACKGINCTCPHHAPAAEPESLYATCRRVWVCKRCGNCLDHCRHQDESNFHEDLTLPCSVKTPAEPPKTCGPPVDTDCLECAYEACPRRRDGCSEYCWQHHKSQCKPLQPESEQVCKCGLTKNDPIHSYTTEWEQIHTFIPKNATPAEPEGEQERLTGVTVGSSRHPHFTHADHERMKATLDALPDNPTEEEAEAVLQVCGTSGKEIVNGFIERLLQERSEMQAELERLRTVTPPETLVVAKTIAKDVVNEILNVPRFVRNPESTIIEIENKIAAIITRYLGATNELVDEVQRRMDHVVETAVEWHQAGREGEEWFEAAEKLGAAINSLLELRDKPAPAPECFCGTELEAGLCPNGHDPVAATTPPSETAVGGEAERRSNHFSNAAIDKGFPAHIGRDNKAHYSDGTVLPAAGGDVMKRAHRLVLNWKQTKINQGDLHPEPDGDLVCAIAAALRSGEGS